ncbi:hypothetical protein CCO04_22565 [Pimelobacter sp. 30-1]|nr:hypothetical protein [Pimelobacter sp. 30-1]
MTSHPTTGRPTTGHPTTSHPATGASATRGSTTPLVAGFAAVILLLVAVVVDASAAQLTRQRLDAVADGAALQGADLGAQGRDAYEGGLAGHDLALSRAAAERAVAGYLRDSGALREHPGLRATVRVEGERVVVVLVVGVELPFRVPGGPGYATVRAVGSAVVRPARRPTTAPVRRARPSARRSAGTPAGPRRSARPRAGRPRA